MPKHYRKYEIKYLVDQFIKEYNIDMKNNGNPSFVTLAFEMDKIFSSIDEKTLQKMEIEYKLFLSQNRNYNSHSKVALSISIFSMAVNVIINSIPSTTVYSSIKFKMAMLILVSSAGIALYIALADFITTTYEISNNRKRKYVVFKLSCLELYLKNKV